MRATAFGLCILLAASAAPAATNLLRNGSFEGGLLYWHGIETNRHGLVRGEAAAGEYALRIGSGAVYSAPVALRRGEPFTVSLFARADRPGRVSVSLPPSAREPGQKAGRLWAKGAGQSAPVTTAWTRASFTFAADVPSDGFWPLPHYLVQISGTVTVLVDGVTVTAGRDSTTDYVPRAPVEIVAECANLPGYAGAAANCFERGATARVTAHVSNPGAEARDVIVRWQLFDYEGAGPVGEAVEKRMSLPTGKTMSETMPLRLTATGCVLARVSVYDGSAFRVPTSALLDSSDLPITSLPYPKSATKPDWRERFGGSFAGGPGCVQKFQRLGFGWIRWRPHANGNDHLPQEPKPGEPWAWQWFDRELDEQEAHGCSAHLCLYPPPKWIMEKGHPLPKDMRWPADDPRWQDLDAPTVWDRFVTNVVEHYRGRSVIFEIENEPDLGSWAKQKAEYAQFTIRTARQIKRTDPGARVMVNNVYGIPSAENTAFFRAGGLKHIDVMSWHDYHAGWLTDAIGIRRMRQAMDEAGGRYVEIWFNEGWAFSNTAVDEPIACTHLTSAQSCNAIMDSVAECTVAGQDKTVLFHTAYETHGMSFWDYSGPGTMLWDWYNYPLPLVAAWNVMAHHIGVSERVGFVRPPGANLCVFQDQRNDRGVIVAYADRDAKSDATVELPLAGLTAEDIMGNPVALAEGRTLMLSRTGRPVFVYGPRQQTGTALLAALEPLDRKHAGFVSNAAAGESVYRLPPTWEGTRKGSADGNPILADGKPVWRIDQLWPDNPIMADSYVPMTWNGTEWKATQHDHGGQPAARVADGTFRAGVRGVWTGNPGQKTCALVFSVPVSGIYAVSGTAQCNPWEGGANTFKLGIYKKDTQRAAEVKTVELPRDKTRVPFRLEVELTAGHDLVFLPLVPAWHNAATISLEDLTITRRTGKQ